MGEIVAFHDRNEIELPHLGITIRVLLAVAAEAGKETGRKTWALKYKNATVGTVRVKLDN
jgi:hypothetical protein